jgi:CubicO group peptidase (beta-lactamase class C family)
LRALYPFAAYLGLLVAIPASAQPEPKKEPVSKKDSVRSDPRPVDDPDWMFEVLEKVREKYNLPSLSASVVIGDRVAVASAAGRRKADDPTPVHRNDRYKIGSVSKPITTTLIGALVDAKVLSFDDTMEDMFPELVKEMQPGYRKVTVAHLLSHTSGMPYAPSKDESHERFKDLDEAVKNRFTYVQNAVADKPLAKPGEKYIYSGGHVIAAHYAERLTKKPVEQLLEEYVYKRLGWTAARDHLNVTTALDRVDGPWPHVLKDGKLVPTEPLGEHGKSRLPVGGVCCTMTELARFLSAHLQGTKGKDGLLTAETFKRLHAAQPEGISAFNRSEVDWAKGLCLWHHGATGDWFCMTHILPEENYAICVATNYGGKDCDQACQAAHIELVKRVHRIKQKLAEQPGRRP